MTSRDPDGERRTILILSTVLLVASCGISAAGLMLTGCAADFLSPPKPITLPAGLVLTVPMLASLYVVRFSRRKWLHDLWQMPRQLIGPAISRATMVELVMIAAMAGVGEELLFRGFLQTWLLERGEVIGLIVPNVLFGLMHWVSPVYAAGTFLVGLYFSCILWFVPEVDLWSLMLAHGLYDLIALAVLRADVRGCH